MIPTYDCAQYLGETLASVLEQDPGPERMQVQVVDDHSSDDPEAVVRAVGGDRVQFFRQPRNVGHVRNFDTCLARSRGHLVHLLHGDDRVRPGFYETMQRPFELHPEIGAAFCRTRYVDANGGPLSLSPDELPEPGIVDDWLERIASGQRVATPSVVVRREVYERLGGYDHRVRCGGEDWEMWVRIAAHYPVGYEPGILAEYRVKRAGSLTGEAHGHGQLVRDMRRMTGLVAGYLPDHLPEQRAGAALRRAGRQYAHWALNDAEELFAGRHLGAGLVHVFEALRCSRTRDVLRRARKLVVGVARETFRSRAEGLVVPRK